MNYRRRLLKLALGTLCGLSLPGIGRAATPQKVTLRVGLASRLGPDIQLQVARQLDDLPYRIEWASFNAAPPAAEALRGGHIDVFSGGDTVAVALAAHPGDAFVVAAAARSLFVEVLVPKNSPIRQIADLKGKRIGFYRGSGSHYGLVLMVEHAGLKWQDIVPVNLAQSDGLGALLDGNIDAWVVWDPNAAIAEKQYGARVLAVPDHQSYSFQFAGRGVLADTERRAALQDYLLRFQKAANWVREHPSALAAREVQLMHLQPDAALLAAGRVDGRYVPIDDALIAIVQREADKFSELGIIAQPVSVRPVFDARFNAVLAAART